MPYYGGKGRMAHFIADRLNYNDSDMFITPFGGACRVLLNKPRHDVEIYNDYGSGLCALMSILSDPSKADDFIHRLYKTEYSQTQFDWAKKIYDVCEIDLEQQARNRLKQLIKINTTIPAIALNDLLDDIMDDTLSIEISHKSTASEILAETLKKRTDFRKEFQKALTDWVDLYRLKTQQGFLERPRDMGIDISDMDLAMATYIVFQQSRDAMGKIWTPSKFKSTQAYRKRVLDLFQCAERLSGVQVYQIDAVDFFRRYKFVDVNTPIETIDPKYKIFNEWFQNSHAIFCCDPSYISPDEEAKLLDGIDWRNVDSLSDTIDEKYKGKKIPKNLGKLVYTMSFDYRSQEKFLRCIQDAKCKILVCNYDLILYNKYLNESTGWRRQEFLTTTSVGGKKDNKRIEVVWYNY